MGQKTVYFLSKKMTRKHLKYKIKNSAINSAINSATAAKCVSHISIEQLPQHLVDKLRTAGLRAGEAGRSLERGAQMLNKIPPSQQAGFTTEAAVNKVGKYLNGKDASHIKAHANGGSSDPSNLLWEKSSINRARGNRDMTLKEQAGLGAKYHGQNLSGAVKMGAQAAGRGAVIGAATAVPFAVLRNFLAVARGEISSEEATKRAAAEIGIAAGFGAGAAFSITTFAAMSPTFASLLTPLGPALLVAGGTLMVKEFFDILIEHEDKIREHYQSLTEQELKVLDGVAAQLEVRHQDNLDFFEQARLFRESILNYQQVTEFQPLPIKQVHFLPKSEEVED